MSTTRAKQHQHHGGRDGADALTLPLLAPPPHASAGTGSAPNSANAPLSSGPFVDAGVYRYERNRKSHEFFSPGPHRYDARLLLVLMLAHCVCVV